MAIQTESKTPSRRALLAGALAGIGAWAASAIGRGSPVRATDPNDVVLGGSNTATTTTSITNSTNPNTVFGANSLGAGIGLEGISGTSVGVKGTSSSYIGVYGQSSTYDAVWGSSTDGVGVFGKSSNHMAVSGESTATDQPALRGAAAGNSTGVLGYSGDQPNAKPKTGVFGYATQDASSKGVWGETTSGAGLYGVATSGYAIRGSGRVKLGKVSGVATITAGNTSKTVSPGVNVTSGSFVLLTPKANIGTRALWFTTNASTNTFTIRMSSSRSSGTAVAWLLLG